MIDKKEEIVITHNTSHESSDSDPNGALAKLTETQQRLEATYCQVQSNIRSTFSRLIETLKSREKQLLRQVDVLQSQQRAFLQSYQIDSSESNSNILQSLPEVRVDLNEEQTLIDTFMSFGKVDMEGNSLAALDQHSVPYRIEEYQKMNEDHVSLYKPLSCDKNNTGEHIKLNFAPQMKSVKLNDESTPVIKKMNFKVKTESTPPQRRSVCNLDCERHTHHVQQWLQQIMVETETEPSVGEVEKKLTSLDIAIQNPD